MPGLRSRSAVTASGIIHGASYVDVHARIPLQWVLVVAAVIGAGLAVYQATQTRLWPVLAAVGLYIGVVIGSGYALILQRFVVAPNEQVREDAVHRAFHRGRPAQVSRSTRCRSASSPAKRSSPRPT